MSLELSESDSSPSFDKENLPRKMGSFKLIRKLGEGAMGVVYEAIHEPSGRRAAVKEMTTADLRNTTGYKRWEREIDILKTLKHPNIVRFYANGRSKSVPYLAMELVEGEALDKLLKKRGAFDWRTVAILGAQLCDALHHAHQSKIIHRDLKPSNLMLTGTPQRPILKLADFGIAKALEETGITATGRTVGTAAYMAPEQIAEPDTISHKTDLYSLGIVLYQLVTGELPFNGATYAAMMTLHLKEKPPRASSKAHLPPEFDDLIDQLLSKAPQDRPFDALAVGERLRAIAAMDWKPQEKLPPRATTEVRTRPRPTSAIERAGWNPETIATLGLVASLVLILSFMLWYIFAPVSTDSLYTQVKAVMDTDNRLAIRDSRFQAKLDELLIRSDLGDRFEQVRSWKDRAMFFEAEDKARTIKIPGQAGSLKRAPSNPIEELYAQTAAEAQRLEADLELEKSAQRWRSMAEQIDAEAPEERGWRALALSEAEKNQAKLQELRQAIDDEMKRARSLIETQSGGVRQAIPIWQNLIEKYWIYPDLRPLLTRGPLQRLADNGMAPPDIVNRP